jgi:hypothetical protein
LVSTLIQFISLQGGPSDVNVPPPEEHASLHDRGGARVTSAPRECVSRCREANAALRPSVLHRRETQPNCPRILKEVFGTDLGEYLSNSRHDGKFRLLHPTPNISFLLQISSIKLILTSHSHSISEVLKLETAPVATLPPSQQLRVWGGVYPYTCHTDRSNYIGSHRISCCFCGRREMRVQAA